jgi:hypothetical protein
LCNGNPPVVYRQGKQKTCLFCATSSIIAYYRDHQGAKVIDDKKNLKLPVNKTTFQVINQTLASTGNKLSGYDIFKVTVDFCEDDVYFVLKPIKKVKVKRILESYSYAMKICITSPK